MQDEVNEKVVSLCIQGGKISARILKNAMAKALAEMRREKRCRKQPKAEAKGRGGARACGKQSMGRLKAQGVELSNIEVTDKNIKSLALLHLGWVNKCVIDSHL